MNDIISLLKADHLEVKALLKKLTADREPADCDELFAKLYASVKAHAHFEEKCVYPLLTEKQATKDIALEAYEEHRQVVVLLDALQAMDDDDETCTAKMNVLSEDLHHHIQEEEKTLFPQLRKAASATRLKELGAQYQAVKGRLKSEESRKTPVHSH
jgi:hemerythrin superfamily protein